MENIYFQSRKLVYSYLEDNNNKTVLSTFINIFLITLITLNVAAFIAQSEPSIDLQFNQNFIYFENFSVAVFTIEYLLRLWCIPEQEGGTFRQAMVTRLHWARSPMALIDLLVILPILLQYYVTIDLRILRLLRMLRILKISRYSTPLKILLNVIAKESGSLGAMLLILGLLIIMAASGIYLVEGKIQPENFGSVPKAMWWAVVTLTTVGYGDVTPLTPLGKLFGACITILGIGIAALPAGILAGGFSDEIARQKQEKEDGFRDVLMHLTLPISPKKLEKLRKKSGVSKEFATMIYKDVKTNASTYTQPVKRCKTCGTEFTD